MKLGSKVDVDVDVVAVVVVVVSQPNYIQVLY